MSPRRTSTWKRSSNAWRSRRAFSRASRNAPMASVKTWSSISSAGRGWAHEGECGGAAGRLPEGGDAAPGLHGVLGVTEALAEGRGGGLEVGDGQGEAEEAGGAVPRVLGRTDHLEDRMAEAEEDLPDPAGVP